jgi:hypothetical protein
MVASKSPPAPAGGPREKSNEESNDVSRGEPPATQGNRRDEARAEELNNLKLALATFALQLDAFELRMRGRIRSSPPKPAYGLQKEEHDQWSTRSHGSKPGA